MGIENPIHLIFLAAVALLVLGPKRLPEVARSLGKGIREFRDAMSDGSVGGFVHPHKDDVPNEPASQPPEAEVVADGDSRAAGPEGRAGAGTGPGDVAGAVVQGTGISAASGGAAVHDAGSQATSGSDQAHGAGTDAGDPAP